MATSQRVFCVTVLIFFLSMAMATENQQAKPSEGTKQGSAAGGGKPAEKTAWPELVGKSGQEAAHAIKVDAPFVHVVVIPFRGPSPPPPPPDYDPHRVRVFVDVGGIVIHEPRIG